MKKRKKPRVLAKCPKCSKWTDQIKNGKQRSGSKKVKCLQCRHSFTPQPKERGYPFYFVYGALNLQATHNNYRHVARLCKVAPQTVVNWVKKYGNGFYLTNGEVSKLRAHWLGKTPGLDLSAAKTGTKYYFQSLRY